MLHEQINAILGEPKTTDVVKRGCIERLLRYVAHENKAKFPELKSTVLVRTWERKTGQSW